MMMPLLSISYDYNNLINNIITITDTVNNQLTGHYVIKTINSDSSVKILKKLYKTKRVKRIICFVFGHQWLYCIYNLDYYYDYGCAEFRKCERCKKEEYDQTNFKD